LIYEMRYWQRDLARTADILRGHTAPCRWSDASNASVSVHEQDDNLNKAHVQYLESRLIALASVADGCLLDNGNVHAPVALGGGCR
jgi:hypothetical protein